MFLIYFWKLNLISSLVQTNLIKNKFYLIVDF